MKLNYKAVTKEGKIVSGIIEAKDIKEAGSYLRTRGFLPIKIDHASNDDLLKLIPFINKTSGGDLVFITRQLASMLSSGLTLMQSLNVLKDQSDNQSVSDMIHGIIADIEDGRSFSQAVEKYPDIFTPVYISLVRAGESSGLLEKVLTRLAENLEKQQELNNTIKGALLYPAIIMIGMGGVMVVMMVFVVPQLSAVYGSLHIELPLTTRIIIGISHFMIGYWPVALVGVVGLVLFLQRIVKSESGKLILDTLILRMPVLGGLITKTILSEFTRTFGLMIGSGTLVTDSLKQVAEVVGNVLYRNAILQVAQRVEKGVTIGDAMQTTSLFPPLVVQMVKIGEQTGKLDDSLQRISEYYEREVTQATKTLTTAMEPIMLLVLGVCVGFLIISIITPIYSLINNIK